MHEIAVGRANSLKMIAFVLAMITSVSGKVCCKKLKDKKLNPTICKRTDLRNYEKKVETVYSVVGLTPVFPHSRLGNLGSLAQ